MSTLVFEFEVNFVLINDFSELSDSEKNDWVWFLQKIFKIDYENIASLLFSQIEEIHLEPLATR